MTVKIDTRPWQRLRKLADRLRAREVRVGVFEGKIAKIATVHEFGAPSAGIAERSYMRSALREHADQIAAVSAKLAGRMMNGKMQEDTALKHLGVFVRDLFKGRIRAQPSDWPPLKPASRRRKGARKNKILINTGQLINSIVFKIVGKQR